MPNPNGNDPTKQPEIAESGTDLIKVRVPRPALINVELGVGEFIGRVLGRPLEQAGGVLADLLGMVRFELAIPYLRRAQRKLQDADLDQAPLPLVDLTKLLPILEWGSVQTENSSVREVWDNLLANAVVAGGTIHPAYADILRQLQPIEARALDFMVDDRLRPKSTFAWSPGANIEGLERENFDNLERLGLIRFYTREYGLLEDAPPPSEMVEATALAAGFVKACRPPSCSEAAQ